VIRRLLLALFIVAAPAAAQPPSVADPQALTEFARQAGVRDVAAFLATVQSLRETRHLPEAYVTKQAAAAHGWHGGGLCEVWPGHVIGGNLFDNFRRQLPSNPGQVWREADLDETCRSRGPERLIFSDDGLIYVSPDHYVTFLPVP
jgi:ribonuclease